MQKEKQVFFRSQHHLEQVEPWKTDFAKVEENLGQADLKVVHVPDNFYQFPDLFQKSLFFGRKSVQMKVNQKTVFAGKGSYRQPGK